MYLIRHPGASAQVHVMCIKMRILLQEEHQYRGSRQRSLERRNRRLVAQTIAQRAPKQTLQPCARPLAYHMVCVAFR